MSAAIAHLLSLLFLLAAAILFLLLGDKELAEICVAAAIGSAGGAGIQKTLGG